MIDTIEKLTCDVILQNPQKIIVKGNEYTVAPPTIATLIEISKYISQIPEIKVSNNGTMIMEVLATAKDCECFGDIAAILMLGKKYLITEKKYLFGLFKRIVDNRKRLASELINNLTPEELNKLIIEIFNMLQVDFFFGISIFLRDINLLKRTKEETTAYGQQ